MSCSRHEPIIERGGQGALDVALLGWKEGGNETLCLSGERFVTKAKNTSNLFHLPIKTPLSHFLCKVVHCLHNRAQNQLPAKPRSLCTKAPLQF